jgi:hypothetical protein
LATGGAFVGAANQVTPESQTRFTTVDNQGNLGTSSFSVGNLQDRFSKIEGALSTVNNQIQQVGAVAAALSAIPNLTTDNQRFGVGFGVGGFGSGWAGAVGAAAKIGDNVWINGALAFTNSVDNGFGSTPSVAGRLGLFYQWGAAPAAPVKVSAVPAPAPVTVDPPAPRLAPTYIAPQPSGAVRGLW